MSNLFYPFKAIESVVDEIILKYENIMNRQGWLISQSGTAIPHEIGNYKKSNFYWQVQKNDELGILNSDEEADELAKNIGIIIDEFGVVQGFDNENLVERINKILGNL